MTFQYCSDLHLELFPECSENKFCKIIREKIQPNGDFLILAGDIGHVHRVNYKFLLKWCSINFEKTFIVTGNHEYYRTNKHAYSIEEVDENTRKVCSEFENIIFLQKDHYEFVHNKCRFIILGCTFWAPIPLEYEAQIAVLMNDYRNIFNNKHLLLRPCESDKMHQDHKTWLFNELDEINSFLKTEKEEKVKVIVITHHAPCLNLNKEIYLPYGYASDYEHLIGNYVYAWVSGHTHEIHNYTSEHGVLFISNCIGYRTQRTGFDKSAVFS